MKICLQSIDFKELFIFAFNIRDLLFMFIYVIFLLLFRKH